MGTPVKKVEWSAEFGITGRHWLLIANYVERNRLYLLVRGGKRAALPWIDLGFPGKPMELGFLKVEPRTGLLWALSPADVRKVIETGNLVLQRVGTGLRAVGSAGPVLARVYAERWAGAGVVIDRQTGLPFTSDYDLAAVIPADDLDYTADVVGYTLGKSRTSGLVEQTRGDLNLEFGVKRFLHGPQALYDQKLGHGPEEHILAFCPNREVYAFQTFGAEAASVLQYRDLLLALHPEKAHVFNQ